MTRARATAASRTTRPVALTPRQGKRHLWQAKQVSFHLCHDDRVKKGAPHRLNSYPFPLPLSISCYRDRERGYFERDPCNTLNLGYKISFLISTKFRCYPLFSLLFFSFFLNSKELFCFI
jgi:hypothetical protein